MGGCPGELWVGEQRWGLRELRVEVKTPQCPVDQEQR